MKTLTLYRNKGWYGRIRALAIFVDGQKIAKISAGKTITINIDDGATELYGKMDWGKTNKINLTACRSGDQLKFYAKFSMNQLKVFAITQIPIQAKWATGTSFS